MPKVSVIMPVFNAADYLSEAIKSILEQTYTDWELIIINDGSTDDSEAIIRSYTDERIRYFENEHNMGLIATLNKGIGLCGGEFIARMDADDISMPERFRIQMKFLEKHKDYAICGGNALIINEKGEVTGKIVNFESNEYLRINLLFSVPFIHPSMMIKANILKDNLFDKDYKHAEDYELWCRIAGLYKIANVPDFVLKYRWHTTNVSVVNSKTQNNVKDTIIRRELGKIGLNPSEEELRLHKISFQQYDAKENRVGVSFSEYDELSDWFEKIIRANTDNNNKYNEKVLIAYLWSRWIVLCISQRKFFKIFKPRFVPLNYSIFKKTLDLLLFYRKK